MRNVEKEFGSVARVADLDAVPGVVVDYLAAQNLPGRVIMAPHPELQAIPWSARPLLEVREGRAQGSDAVSVQHGFAGIAETGTLMLPSASGAAGDAEPAGGDGDCRAAGVRDRRRV